jgi:tRNA(Arg) A34 adenosine deaminase TadA
MFAAPQNIWDRLYVLAKTGQARGEVPVAAAIMRGGEVIALAHNEVERAVNPCAHAEMLVLQAACAQLNTKFLQECDLYVTLEPCAMCAGAIAHSRLRRLYFAAYDVKAGAVESGVRLLHQPTCHHRPEIYGGLQEARFAALMTEFFQALR